MTRYYEWKSTTLSVVDDETLGRSNKWSRLKHVKSKDSPRSKAEDEFDLFDE